MRLRISLALFMGMALLVCQFTGRAQEAAPTFTLYSSDPVVSHSSQDSDWDGRYTDPGAVLYHNGLFHMFRNGFRGWPASVQIGYLTSPDGFTWTEASEAPVLMSDEVPFTNLAALASSALVEEDGTWVLYFYTWNQSRPPEGVIGRATAEDPLGPWTLDPEPVLLRGGEEAWDSAHIGAPSVVRTDDGYVMYYEGNDTINAAIGMATSEDGIHWTKYDDPATTEAPFAESDPILVSHVEGYNFHQPRVERTEEGYLMIFRFMPRPGTGPTGQMGLGIATSQDGSHWEVRSDEPFWERSTIPGTSGFWYTATAYHDSTLYLYIEGGRGRGTDIFLVTSEGPFFEE